MTKIQNKTDISGLRTAMKYEREVRSLLCMWQLGRPGIELKNAGRVNVENNPTRLKLSGSAKPSTVTMPDKALFFYVWPALSP